MESKYKLKEREWNKLINKIENEEVILILGDELSMLNIQGQKVLLKDYLLDQLVNVLNDGEMDSSKQLKKEDVRSFPDISYETMKGQWQKLPSDPYTETAEILSNIPSSSYETTALKKLLSIDKFKTIITTSFDESTYIVLDNLYGKDSIMRLEYVKRTNGQDIPLNTDKRVLYHLFGKASSEMHSYVLSEDDLLEFIHFWMDQNYRPKNLANILSDKYILVIGCNYPNWLFRFFFHSLKYTPTPKGEKAEMRESRGCGLLADHDLDQELISFLRRMETSVHEDAINFIDELYERWKNRTPSYTINEAEGKEKEEEAEAFISYASEDFDTVSDIVKTFKELGYKKIWFDKKKLEGGDKYETLIKNRIEKAKVFIPILSFHTEKSDGPRFFRKEWKWAKDTEEAHFGTEDNYIRPILIDRYVMSEKQVFKDCHSVDMSNPEERKDLIQRMIRNIRK